MNLFEILEPKKHALIVTGRSLERIFSRKKLTEFCFNRAAMC